jgi:hypothetical protein
MKTGVMKKRLVASVITALLAVSACSVTAFAAEQPEKNIDLQQVTLESTESSEGGFTAEPEYLNPILRGTAIPHRVKDLSNQTHTISGTFVGAKTLYSEYMFIGKYTYNVELTLNENAGTRVSYYVRNASSNNKIMDSGVLKAGESIKISVPGFSKTSKMFIQLTGHDDISTKPCIIWGKVS